MKIWETKPPGTLWATPGPVTGLLYLYLCVKNGRDRENKSEIRRRN
jgi:hypothetical protein